jgi:hypothetical protein
MVAERGRCRIALLEARELSGSNARTAECKDAERDSPRHELSASDHDASLVEKNSTFMMSDDKLGAIKERVTTHKRTGFVSIF